MKRRLTGTPGGTPAQHAHAGGGTAALDADLARLGRRAGRARVLLTALAWGRAPGLPRERLWVPVARALAGPGGVPVARAVPGPGGVPADEVTESDVRWLLRKAGRWVSAAAGPGGQTVHRLRDGQLAAALRGQASARGDHGQPVPGAAEGQGHAAEAAVTGALLATVPAGPGGRRWREAHPYVRAFLAQHAAAAGQAVLARLVAEPGFLAAADPVMLGPLMFFTDPPLRDVARVYQRALPVLGDDPSDNAACLAEAAMALGLPPLQDGADRSRAYLTRFTAVRRDDSLRTIPTEISTSVALAAAPDGQMLLAVGCDDGLVWRYDAVTGEPAGEPLAGHSGDVIGVALGSAPGDGDSGGGRLLLASCGYDQTVRIWDPLTGEQLGDPLTGHTGWVWVVAFATAPDGRLLVASASDDRTVRVWDALSHTPVGEPLTGHTDRVQGVAFGTTPQGRLLLASSSHDTTVRVWDPLTGTALHVLTGHTKCASRVAFGTVPGAGGRLLLASAGWDGTVRVWDPVTGTPAGEPLAPDAGQIVDVAFGTTPDGRLLLAAGCDDHTVRRWDPVTGATAGGPLSGSTGVLLWLSFATTAAAGDEGGGRLLLASSAWEKAVKVWDPVLATDDLDPALARLGSVSAVACAERGGRTLLACAGRDYAVRVFDLSSGSLACGTLPPHKDTVGAVAFGTLPRDGAAGEDRLLLVSASLDRSVRVWDPLAGTAVAELPRQPWPVVAAAFGTVPGGRGAGAPRLLLACASEDGTVRIWDPVTGTAVGEPMAAHHGWVGALAFGTVPRAGQEGGRLLLASAGEDATVRLWDPLTCQPAGRPLTGSDGHTGPVTTVAFGTMAGSGAVVLASGGQDGTVRLWDPVAGTATGPPLAGHGGWVAAVAFPAGRGGRTLLASGGDTTIQVWDAAAGARVQTLRRRAAVSCLAACGPLLAIGEYEGVSVVELAGAAAGA